MCICLQIFFLYHMYYYIGISKNTNLYHKYYYVGILKNTNRIILYLFLCNLLFHFFSFSVDRVPATHQMLF